MRESPEIGNAAIELRRANGARCFGSRHGRSLRRSTGSCQIETIIQYYLNNQRREARMPGRVDLVFAFFLVVVASVVEYAYFWPRFRADVAAERPRTRARGYRRVIIGEWLFAFAAIAIWATRDRPWSSLRLSLPHGWRLAVSGLLVIASLALVLVQLSSVARLSAARRAAAHDKLAAAAARGKLASVAFLLPRTRDEATWFVALSATAGFCEELLYRGYLPWLFAPWLGSIGGMALGVLIFGSSHAYQGLRGAVKATITGAVLATIVLATGSLIPAMILHALIDAVGGTVGYLLLRNDPSPGALFTNAAQDAA
jgi:hypothetical protein